MCMYKYTGHVFDNINLPKDLMLWNSDFSNVPYNNS